MLSRPALILVLWPAWAQAASLELGLRLELLTLEQPLQFSCDQPCDDETDPDCVFTPAEELCAPETVTEPHHGWLFGGLLGAYSHGDVFSAGLRFAATIGYFDPDPTDATDTGATAVDGGFTLSHVTVELPLEAHLGQAYQIYVQVVPRLGTLNLLAGRSEEPDTFTAGVLATVGVRFAVSETHRVTAAAQRIAHPTFGGWGAEAGYLIDDL